MINTLQSGQLYWRQGYRSLLPFSSSTHHLRTSTFRRVIINFPYSSTRPNQQGPTKLASQTKSIHVAGTSCLVSRLPVQPQQHVTPNAQFTFIYTFLEAVTCYMNLGFLLVPRKRCIGSVDQTVQIRFELDWIDNFGSD